jgi:hypothetical protein
LQLFSRTWKVFELLKEHPRQRFGETNEECFEKHRFLQKLLHGAANANIAANENIEDTIKTLLQWGRLIDADFHRRNFMFVSLESLMRVLPMEELGNTFEADSRSFYDHFYNSSRAFQQLHVDWYMVREKVSALHHLHQEQIQIRRQELENQAIIIQQNNTIINLLQHKGLQILGSTVASNKVDQSGAAAHSSVPQQQGPDASLRFVSLPGLADLTVQSIFLSWHRNQYYKLPVRSTAPKDKNTRFVIKTAIEYFTLFFDSHVDPLPENLNPGQPSPERTQWDEQLKKKLKELGETQSTLRKWLSKRVY